MAGVNLERLTEASMGEHFQQWEKVARALEQKKMPPEKMPQPSDAERNKAVAWIRAKLKDAAAKNPGDPGRVTVRRLTSGEYAYTIRDLTGLELRVDRDFVSDAVGGEGFANFGDVQFMGDADVERYLIEAKKIADHAVIGAGPIEFYEDPGKTAFELSAINRIREIYSTYGFRTVSGEGGRPFGLERYGKALYVAWRYRHRAALGESKATLETLAAREGITRRFANHIWLVLNRTDLSYPSSEVVSRWHKLPAPAADIKASATGARAQCEEIQKFLTTWPSWLFARGDVAAGGAGDERPLEFSDSSLKVTGKHRFRFIRGGRGGGRGPALPAGGTARIYLNAALVNPNPNAKPVVIWRNPTIAFRPAGAPRNGQNLPAQPTAAEPATVQPPSTQPTAAQLEAGTAAIGQAAVRRFGTGQNLPRHPLKAVVTEESAKALAFGQSPDGSAMGPEDFASEGSIAFDVKLPDGISVFDLQVDAEVGTNRNQVFRVTISDRPDGGTRGVPVWGLVGDPQSSGYRAWKGAVLEFARILPPNSHGEPTPADKDPIPEPFDNTYNVPEHDEFVLKVKYIRDDRFVVENIIDDATRARLDHAWNDLYASFEYHDAYLRLLSSKFSVDLKGKGIADLDQAQIGSLPSELGKYVRPLRSHYEAVQKARMAAQPGHVDDCIRFAGKAWRRPLSEAEKDGLRSFYVTSREAGKLDHDKAIRALLARILIAPAFLYRLEQPAVASGMKPLSGSEIASRLSYFLWSSVPDAELERAAKAGELANSQEIERQVKRMLADPKARRLSTEFFGQWLGFYRFDQYSGVDTTRFPEFTDDVKSAMYEEAVSFFEHIIRKDRPLREMLFADYTFLNRTLAKHYGVKKEIASVEDAELVSGANDFQRGGLLRLGAVLTATSAPLRTSPVKRGDWLLRRVLGMPTPPPPADAGSIPADDKAFGGLTLFERLETHKRNPTCASCHTRIDPLGFPLERYDAVGRWRDQYSDGKPVHDSSTTADQTLIAGVDGLLSYLRTQENQVLRTFSNRLLGYALGRTILISDQPLIDRLTQAGSDASFSKLVAEIATSRQFLHRRGREEAPPAGTSHTAGAPAVKKSTKEGGL